MISDVWICHFGQNFCLILRQVMKLNSIYDMLNLGKRLPENM